MRKFYLVLAFCALTCNAQAFDLTTAANKLANGINDTAQSIEDKKAEREAAYKEQLKEERKALKVQNAQKQKELLKAAKNSGKSIDEIISIISNA